MARKKEIEKEELQLVDRGVKAMMADIKLGKIKTYSLEEVK
jgi:hypothetical protein